MRTPLLRTAILVALSLIFAASTVIFASAKGPGGGRGFSQGKEYIVFYFAAGFGIVKIAVLSSFCRMASRPFTSRSVQPKWLSPVFSRMVPFVV